jgi:hypothetical protein
MTRILERLIYALVATLLIALPAVAQQVMLERDSPLYAEPRLESAQVTQLKQGASGEVIGKQGAWLNLKTAGGSGWLFSFNVRFQSQKAEGADGGGSTLGRVFGPRRNVNVTSAIGIRGLDEQDLKQASFSDAQMKLLDGYTASKQSAEDGARATGLAPEKVEYLGAKR